MLPPKTRTVTSRSDDGVVKVNRGYGRSLGLIDGFGQINAVVGISGMNINGRSIVPEYGPLLASTASH
jgi:hypothetical protein